MQHRTADKLVYCHETIHLHNKLQDAGWAPDVVAHESDSESDSGSDNEAKDLSEIIFSYETIRQLIQ